MVTGVLAEGYPPVLQARRTLRAAEILSRRAELLADEDGASVHTLWFLVWSFPARIESLPEMRQFVEFLKGLQAPAWEMLFGLYESIEAVQVALDHWWVALSQAGAGRANWEELARLLAVIEDIASGAGVEALRAAAIRAKAFAKARYVGAQDVLKELEDAGPRDADSRFLMALTKAQIVHESGRPGEALGLYEDALHQSTDAHAFLGYGARRLAGKAAGECGRWGSAVTHLREALRWSRSSRRLSPLDIASIHGELGVALWFAGQPRKACGAMYSLLKMLERSVSDKAAQRVELLNKAGHALGWLASVAYTGEPPAALSPSQEYLVPPPGFFWLPSPAIGALGVRAPAAVLWIQLAMLAEGTGSIPLALKAAFRAKELAEKDRLLLLAGQANSHIAPLAAALGQMGKAVGAAIPAIQFIAMGKKLHENGEELMSSKADPAVAWNALQDEKKREAERSLFFSLVVAPAVARILFGRAGDQTLEDLWQAISAAHDQLVDPDYWGQMIDCMRYLIFPTTFAEIQRRLAEVPKSDFGLRVILYLAGANALDATLVWALQTHGEVLRGVAESRLGGDFLLEGITRYLITFWQEVGRTRGPSLRNPVQFREELEEVPEKPRLSDAAQVLLWAEHALGIVSASDLRDWLVCTAHGDTSHQCSRTT
jgi:tetratricopeptide (TPR) repeat protein